MQPVTTAPGVPLAHYRQHQPGAGVWLICLDCQLHRSFELEDVIRWLGEKTGVREVAAHARKPCPQCGGARLESRPMFPTRPKGEGWTV